MKFSDVIKTLCVCGCCVLGGMCEDVRGMERYLDSKNCYNSNAFQGELCDFVNSTDLIPCYGNASFDMDECRSFLINTMRKGNLCSLLDITIPNEVFYLELPLRKMGKKNVISLNCMLWTSSEEAADLLQKRGINQRCLIDSFICNFDDCSSKYLGTELVIAFRGMILGSFKALEFFGWHMSTPIARPKNKFEEFIELNNMTNMNELAADLIAFAYASNLDTVIDSIDDFESMFGVIECTDDLLDIGDDRISAYGSIIRWRANRKRPE